MPTRHLIGCVIAVIGLASLVTLIAPSAGGFAVVAAFLLCPLVMLIAMKLLMGGHANTARITEPAEPNTQLREQLRR